jgi:4-carboxymuconolactone decarboxylase
MDEQGRLDLGMTTRRAVLGDSHVDRSIKNTTPFTADFQEFITRYAWGTVWTRDGLDQVTRRLLVLTTTIALNREGEFKLHFRAALEHGVALDTLKEMILQSALYCGLPAANTAFHWASDVLAEREKAAG